MREFTLMLLEGLWHTQWWHFISLPRFRLAAGSIRWWCCPPRFSISPRSRTSSSTALCSRSKSLFLISLCNMCIANVLNVRFFFSSYSWALSNQWMITCVFVFFANYLFPLCLKRRQEDEQASEELSGSQLHLAVLRRRRAAVPTCTRTRTRTRTRAHARAHAHALAHIHAPTHTRTIRIPIISERCGRSGTRTNAHATYTRTHAHSHAHARTHFIRTRAHTHEYQVIFNVGSQSFLHAHACTHTWTKSHLFAIWLVPGDLLHTRTHMNQILLVCHIAALHTQTHKPMLAYSFCPIVCIWWTPLWCALSPCASRRMACRQSSVTCCCRGSMPIASLLRIAHRM